MVKHLPTKKAQCNHQVILPKQSHHKPKNSHLNKTTEGFSSSFFYAVLSLECLDSLSPPRLPREFSFQTKSHLELKSWQIRRRLKFHATSQCVSSKRELWLDTPMSKCMHLLTGKDEVVGIHRKIVKCFKREIHKSANPLVREESLRDRENCNQLRFKQMCYISKFTFPKRDSTLTRRFSVKLRYVWTFKGRPQSFLKTLS